ncbi:MAG: YggS family pyridoxal phosphate-dependent enzyme [Phycisphaerales bacterium]
MTLESRYRDVLDRVDRAARRSGRTGADVLVVAVSKYAGLDEIRELLRLGHQDFGESRAIQLEQRAALVDEMLERRHAMPDVDDREGLPIAFPDRVRWHMIGHLQRNKVKKVAPVARLIHTVDSLRLVEELQSFAVKRDVDIDCLVQVNCSGEDQKYGCPVAATHALCEQIDLTGNLRIRGLMTMAANTDDEREIRSTFRRCAEIFEDISKENLGEGGFNILSMGMSGDFEIAIECGANMVRVGSAIFGSHLPHDHEEQPEED